MDTAKEIVGNAALSYGPTVARRPVDTRLKSVKVGNLRQRYDIDPCQTVSRDDKYNALLAGSAL